MKERKGIITVKGNPMTLVGAEIKIPTNAPDAELLDNDLKPVKISSFRGKICVICSVPSLDTPVCDTETKRFNSAALNLSQDVVILAVSTDLPFAQKRWCGANNITRVKTLSDHRDASFGTAYGVLVKELRLLARSIFILDREGMVRYVQLVKELSSEPDYNAVLKEIAKLA